MPYVTGIEEYLTIVIEQKCEEKFKKLYMEQGLQEGIVQGREKGREEGMEKGMEEGREKERAVTVRRMLSRGMSVAQIADIFEISDEQVCQLSEDRAG